MRIVHVSAHYPPELISGGTLQPQRLASAQRSQGHDVQVLAGSIDSSRTPLDTWETFDDGMPVHWVATHQHVWWDDEGNYDNAGVRAVADSLFDAFTPDVVHCHALQTLGVGPIDAAAARGIPIVVTMHDFWWVCARQFLVDTANRPCPLVVAASDCPCEAGRNHLDRRNDRLRAALAQVDQVLVPSRAAAEVLVANGVPADRVAVDPNGLPDHAPPRERSPRRPGSPVTVRYTGGSNPLKGADVVLASSDAMGDLPKVRLVAHGMDEAMTRHRRSPGSFRGELCAPYAPAELEEVLADTDVLLLPSIMRETFSIVTREALTQGVPVIASDVLGPEEVVEDGRNGRIVPAGDSSALVTVLRELDADPTLADRWAAGITALDVRSVEAQAADLVARYERLPSHPAPAHDSGRHAVLFVVGIDGAPLRYRVQLPMEALGLLGVPATLRHYLDPDLDDAARGATHIVLYRVPATPRLLDQIDRWRRSGTPVAFDADDLIFDPDLHDEIPALSLLPADEAALWLEGVRRYRTTMEACDAYIGSTTRLVEHARDAVGIPAHLFENGVGQVLGAAADRALRRPRRPGPPRIGYLSGTTTHDDDLRFVAPALRRVLHEHADVELWLVGHLELDEELIEAAGTRLRRIPFTPWHELSEILRDLDVNLAPLAPGSRFNDAKSAIKWLEAALCQTPTIASPTEPFRRTITPNDTGLLAGDPDEWVTAIGALLDDDPRREQLGRRAQRAALLGWSPPLQGQRYLAVLDAIAAGITGRRPSPTWEPTVRDERPGPEAIRLTSYPPSTAPARRTWISARDAHLAQERTARHRWTRLRRSLREDGLAVTGRRIVGAVAKRARRG